MYSFVLSLYAPMIIPNNETNTLICLFTLIVIITFNYF